MGEFSINGAQNWDVIPKTATEIFKPTYLLADSRASMIESDYCRCLFQEIRLTRCSIWLSEYRMLQTAKLLAVVDNPLLELHCMLKGGMNYQTDGLGYVQMLPNTFNLHHQPHVMNRVDLPQKAHVITFDILFEPEYLLELCQHYPELNPFMERFLKNEPRLLQKNACPLNRELSSIIQSVLYAPPRLYLQQVLLEKAIETYVMDAMYYLTNGDRKPLRATSFERKAVQEVIKHLQTNPDDHSTILKLAKQFAINSSQLKRLFKEATGLTIGEFRTRERMTQASFLLREGESVSTTAFTVGYHNPSAFIHRFRQVYLLSPLQ